MMQVDMPRRLPPGCVEDKDRFDNVRIYFRAEGRKKVRLRGTPWTETFMEEYRTAKAGGAVSGGQRIEPGTWRWLCVQYFGQSADYKRLDKQTRRVRRQILEATFTEKARPDSNRLFADMPLSKMDGNAVEVLRDRKISTPESANSRLKAMRQVFKWAVRKKLVPHDPARDVDYFKGSQVGFHTWTVGEVAQFQERYPIGTKARLALDLILYTGQRRSDVIRFGRQHVSGDKLTFTQHKGRNRKPKRLTLPLLPVLQQTLAESPCGDLTFLVTEFGRPFTDGGFGNWFRDRCVQAGVPGRAHGLRKAGATIAADNGATAHQLMAIFGWDTIKQAENYTRKANQQRLAENAMHMISVPLSNAVGQNRQKASKFKGEK
jgi:integrase